MPIDCLALPCLPNNENGSLKKENRCIVVVLHISHARLVDAVYYIKTREGGLSRKNPPAWSSERSFGCAVVFVVKKNILKANCILILIARHGTALLELPTYLPTLPDIIVPGLAIAELTSREQ